MATSLLSILGIFLIITPFGLIFYFRNRLIGFLTILIASISFHLILALISQFWQFFNYSVIITVNLVAFLAILIWALKNFKKANFKIIIKWPLLLGLLIVIFQLFAVHFLYSGTINTIRGHETVHNFSYKYPYFADEWAGVAFTNYSIKTQSLPLTNPLIDGEEHNNFPNIFVAFFSFLAEIFLLTQINPLLGFVPLSIITGTLLCFLIYVLLKSSKIEELPAIIAMLVVPWIVNSSKLPGIWYLFPFILGAILFFSGLVAYQLKNRVLFFIANLLTLLFYPPLVVFVLPVLILEIIIRNKKNLRSLVKEAVLLYFITAAIIFLILVLQPNNYSKLLVLFANNIIRVNYDGTIPTRFIWQVVPLLTLPFAFLGIIKMWQKKMYLIFASTIIGLIFWLVYSFSKYYLAIDYTRIAAIASYLTIVAFGVGAGSAFELLKRNLKKEQRKQIINVLTMITLAFFLGASFFYTRYEGWKNIRLIYQFDSGPWQAPIEAPANNYLSNDDLRIFSNISQTRFFTLPWKGLVIGAATNNYPVLTKGSTITNFMMHEWVFVDASCYGKDYLAEVHNIKYVYLPPFNCPNFIFIDKSSEGLHLYEFKK